MSTIPAFLQEVTLAHFHHHLRDTEADEDERFVRHLAEQLGLKYRRGDWTPGSRESLPRADRNLQAAARKARYEFLGRTARSLGYSVVLTAHHRRDQVETVLQNLARGGKSGAWRGIRESFFRDGVTFLRPLLPFPPDRLKGLLEAMGQSFRQDSSNADPKYRRNWVRHDLLPCLYEAYPDFEECAAQICKKCEERERYWHQKALELKKRGFIRKDSIVLSRRDLAQFPEEGRFFCIREILQGLGSPPEASGWAPTRRKPLDAFFSLLDRGGDGTIDLPGGIHARFSGNVVILQSTKVV
jgi:tRNA(Ile)-lysidine synthase